MKSTLFLSLIGLIFLAGNVQAQCSSCDKNKEYCSNNKCKAKKIGGEKCSDKGECFSGKCNAGECGCITTCIRGKCISGKCQFILTLPEGSWCDGNENCTSGICCKTDSDRERKKCQKNKNKCLKPKGEDCVDSKECESGNCYWVGQFPVVAGMCTA